MGNSDSQATQSPSSIEDVLIHAFKLDADFNVCSFPFICPRKQVMFHVPPVLSDNLEHFFPLIECRKVIEDLNNIFKVTGYSLRPNNPPFIAWAICMFIIFLGCPTSSFYLYILLGVFTLGCHFTFFFFLRNKRKTNLLAYLCEWNSSRNNQGVKLTLGGFVNNPRHGARTGNEQGGYYNFYVATWDRGGNMATGYLNVFVNVSQRQEWCRQNGVPFLMPLATHQQTMVPPQNQQTLSPPDNQQILPPSQGYPGAGGFIPPASAQGYIPPAGYALVPLSQVQVPSGYTLVPQDQVNKDMATAPQNQDLPPSYEESTKH